MVVVVVIYVHSKLIVVAVVLPGNFIHNHVLSWIDSFLVRFASDRMTSGTFALWQTNIAHEASYTRVARLDADLVGALRHYVKTVDNFAVVIMGDHGLGYGPCRPIRVAWPPDRVLIAEDA